MPGTPTTLQELRNPERRPDQPSQPIGGFPTDTSGPRPPCHPHQQPSPGPETGSTSLTAEALRLILDDEAAMDQFVQVCQVLAQGLVPERTTPRPWPRGCSAKTDRGHPRRKFGISHQRSESATSNQRPRIRDQFHRISGRFYWISDQARESATKRQNRTSRISDQVCRFSSRFLADQRHYLLRQRLNQMPDSICDQPRALLKMHVM